MTDTYCTRCGHVGGSYTLTPGGGLLEVLLWLCFLLPGILYSLWRRSAAYEACAQCQSGALIPMSSPILEGRREELTAASNRDAPAPHRGSETANAVIGGLVLLAAALVVLSLCKACSAQEAKATTSKATVPVTFYYPRSFPGGAAVLYASFAGLHADFPLHIFTGTEASRLMTLRPNTYVTVKMAPGAYSIGAHYHELHIKPIPITVPTTGHTFLRISVPQGWRKDWASAFRLVTCTQAQPEAAKLAPLRAKDLVAPLQAVDTGATFPADCTP